MPSSRRNSWLSVAALVGGFLSIPGTPAGANPIEVGGMQVAWKHEGDMVVFTLEAPTSGWVAIGFNSVDDIVGADLVMARGRGNSAEAEHHYVLAPGDHRPVSVLGKESMIHEVDGGMVDGRIRVRLSLRGTAHPSGSQSLAPGTRLYLICAYSVSPDFDHHSRMRRHLPVEL